MTAAGRHPIFAGSSLGRSFAWSSGRATCSSTRHLGTFPTWTFFVLVWRGWEFTGPFFCGWKIPANLHPNTHTHTQEMHPWCKAHQTLTKGSSQKWWKKYLWKVQYFFHEKKPFGRNSITLQDFWVLRVYYKTPFSQKKLVFSSSWEDKTRQMYGIFEGFAVLWGLRQSEWPL